VHWVQAEKKDSWLFAEMLHRLTEVYQKAPEGARDPCDLGQLQHPQQQDRSGGVVALRQEGAVALPAAVFSGAQPHRKGVARPARQRDAQPPLPIDGRLDETRPQLLTPKKSGQTAATSMRRIIAHGHLG